MSKAELFLELNERLHEIKEMVNNNEIVSLQQLNYQIDWAARYLMMLMER